MENEELELYQQAAIRLDEDGICSPRGSVVLEAQV
jgi:hypothetical protein